jgi:hypothetical protein
MEKPRKLITAQSSRLDDLPADERIEVPGGLVGDDDLGVVDHGSGDGGALLFPARQLGGSLLRLVGQTHQRQGSLDRQPDAPPGRARHLEREGDVLAHGLAGQQLEVLEDDADLPP